MNLLLSERNVISRHTNFTFSKLDAVTRRLQVTNIQAHCEKLICSEN